MIKVFACCLVFAVANGLPSLDVGISYDAIERIVGGRPADPGEYPTQVSITYAGLHNCGGTIISEKFILTAAHCVKLPGGDVMAVKVGTNNWSEGVQHEILNLIPHPGFNFTDFSSEDIGLIELLTKIEFNNITQPVVLPAPGLETPGGSPAIIVGWGLLSDNSTLPPLELQEADVIVRDFQECYNIYSPEGTNITDAQVCADVPEGGIGVCSGDSGGPLFVDGVIVGITSWSANGCAAKGYPGVFTRVASYRDWIFSIAGV